MLDFYNDITAQIGYNPQNNKFAFQRQAIGAHDYIDIDTVTTAQTASNSIYVSYTTGNDSTGTGLYAAPYKTILKGCNSCTSTKIYVVILDSTLYAEDLSDLDNSYFSGLFAYDSSTPKLSLRTLDYTESDANTIFVASSTSTTGADGTRANPYATIAEARAACNAGHQNIMIDDSEIYTEAGWEFTGNVKNLRAKIGEKPTVMIDGCPVGQLNAATYEKLLDSTEIFDNVDDYRVLSNVCSVLPNDNICVARLYNSKSSFKIIDSSGEDVLSEIIVCDDSDTHPPMCFVLSNGNILISFWDDVASRRYIKIYDTTGAIIIDDIEITTDDYDIYILPLPGKFAVLYTIGSPDGYIKIYNNNGTVSISAVRIDSTANIINVLSIALLTNNNICIAYREYFSAGTLYYNKFIIVDQNLNLIVSAVTLSPGYTLASESIFICSGIGQFIIIYPYMDSPHFRVYYHIYDNSGSVVKSKTDIGSISEHGAIAAISTSFNSYFVSILETGSYGVFYNIDSMGNIIDNGISFHDPTVSGEYWNFSSAKLSNGSIILYFNDADSVKSYMQIWNPITFNYFKISVDSIINGIDFDIDNYNLLKYFINGNSASLNISYCTFRDSVIPNIDSYIIYSDDEVNVDHCQINDGDIGIYAATTASIIKNNLFYRLASGYACHIDGTAATGPTIEFSHNTVFDCYGGLRLENNGGSELVKNNIFHENDIYDVNAETAITMTYSLYTGNLNNVTSGASVIKANPLFINEGAIDPDDIDLQIKLRLLGYPADSPAYQLADDTTPDRDAGAWDIIPIGSATTWTYFTFEKPAKGIDLKYEPIGALINKRKDGSIKTGFDDLLEIIEFTFEGIRNAEFNNFLLMVACKKSQIKLYPDFITNPTHFNLYEIIYETFSASAAHYKLTRTGRQKFIISFGRAYE